MKMKYSSMIVMISLILTLSCDNLNEFDSIDPVELSKSIGGIYLSNHLKIESTENQEILILQESLVKSQIYQTAYILQTEDMDIVIPKSTSHQSILFNKSILLKSDKKWTFIGVDIEENTILLKRIEDKLGKQNISSHLGYGFSQIKGEWGMETRNEQASAFDYLGKFNKANSSAKLPGGGGGASCTSGGPGATSCSIGDTIGPIGTSCSVTCSDGYYACCKTSNTTCKCVKNDAD